MPISALQRLEVNDRKSYNPFMRRRFQFSLRRMFHATAAFSLSAFCVMHLVNATDGHGRSAAAFFAAAIIALELGAIVLYADEGENAVWSIGIAAIAAAIGCLIIVGES